MDIPYRQLSAREALETYADWLLEQRIEKPFQFFRCLEQKRQAAEWYMIFYPLRALMLASDILKNDKYRKTAFQFIDIYLSEQLPGGGFTSNYRRQPTSNISRREYDEILRTGKVNLADNGSNVTAVIQAAMSAPKEKREQYLKAARTWLTEWVPLWALPEGGYGNGIWVGHKINTPYTCAIGTVTAALSAFSVATGEMEFVENAERCMKFQCSHWLPDGRPVNFDCYPMPRKTLLNDFGHSFYLLEGMCWTHYASKNTEVRGLIENRMTEWIFGKEGLLSQWRDSWFNFQMISYGPEKPEDLPMSRQYIRPGWELAKSNGILHAFLYYLNHINENQQLREKAELGLKFLSNPLMARMSGVASDPDESYGMFAVQATGFAGLSIAEGLAKDSVFNLKAK